MCSVALLSQKHTPVELKDKTKQKNHQALILSLGFPWLGFGWGFLCVCFGFFS